MKENRAKKEKLKRCPSVLESARSGASSKIERVNA